MKHTTLVNLLALVSVCSAGVILIRDKAISLPDEYALKGNLLCKTASWTTFIAFYFGNYVAHLATIRFPPGATVSNMAFIGLVSLAFPALGVAQGVQAIFSCAVYRGRRSALDMAVHAGALCMVVRSKDWRPPENKVLTGVLVPGMIHDITPRDMERGMEQPLTNTASPSLRTQNSNPTSQDRHLSENAPNRISVSSKLMGIYHLPIMCEGSKSWENLMSTSSMISVRGSNKAIHGSYKLPHGYKWETVPYRAKVYPTKGPEPEATHHEVSSSYSLVKAGASLVQTVYATLTLYHARGDQIDRYGCAAFGLTVAPYAIMSFINLIGSLLTPEYSAVYMVSSEVMEEAIDDDGFFEGVVGVLRPEAKEFCGPTQYTGTFSRTESELVFKGQPATGNHHDRQARPIRPAQKDQGTLSFPLPSFFRKCLRAFNPLPPNDSDIFRDGIIYLPNHPAFECASTPKFSILESNLYRWSNPNPLAILRYSPQHRGNIAHVILSYLPLAVVGALSGFQAKSSSLLQRLATMSWLAAGTPMGLGMGMILLTPLVSLLQSGLPIRSQALVVFVGMMIVAPLPIGGFIVVGQMLKEYGECIRV